VPVRLPPVLRLANTVARHISHYSLGMQYLRGNMRVKGSSEKTTKVMKNEETRASLQIYACWEAAGS
jgi:hypothetical protein